MGQVTVRQFEEKVLEKEEVVIVIRAPANSMVEDYEYARKAAGNASVTDWVEQRIKPCLKDTEFTIVNGDHTHPHGRTKLDTLRSGYEK